MYVHCAAVATVFYYKATPKEAKGKKKGRKDLETHKVRRWRGMVQADASNKTNIRRQVMEIMLSSFVGEVPWEGRSGTAAATRGERGRADVVDRKQQPQQK